MSESAMNASAESAVKGSDTRRRRLNGLGSVYSRPKSAVLWIQYRRANGQRVRESTGETSWPKAVALLKERIAALGRNPQADPATGAKVRLMELFDAVERDYRMNKKRSIDTLGFRLKPLREFFGDRRALDVTTTTVEAYKAERLERVAAATVNRELAALRRAYRLAIKQDRITYAPNVELLEEDNVREGFLEPGDFEAVVAALPEYLQDAARFAYIAGWRRGEVASLAWSQVDRKTKLITLRRANSKNKESRVLPIGGALEELIARRWEARTLAGPDGSTRLADLVFHRQGVRLGDFRKAWASACQAAGRKGTLFHDMRRSAVRNLERAGVSQAVAMKITGHKTGSVYRRYRIVSTDDIATALQKVQVATSDARPSVVPLRPAVEA